MNVTIMTATLQTETRTVPLQAKHVNQLRQWQPQTKDDLKDVIVHGTVYSDREYQVLVTATNPAGHPELFRMLRSNWYNLGLEVSTGVEISKTPRIVLL